MNEKLQISIKSGKAYAHSFSQMVQTPADGSAEDRYLHASPTDAIRQQQFNPNDGWFGSYWGKVVTLLHFSDIHGDTTELARIVDYLKTLPSSVVPLFTGDMVRNTWVDGIDFWTNTQGTDKILVAIGNHDTYYSKTAAECYTRYLAPNIASWGVTYTENVCYYYKDWSAYNLRLIVLDCMHWDATQQSWLVATLASAKTAGYHIVCGFVQFKGEWSHIDGDGHIDIVGINFGQFFGIGEHLWHRRATTSYHSQTKNDIC